MGLARAVDGVDLRVARRGTIGVVGESGSGKTVMGRSILRLVPKPHGRIAEGRIEFEGEDLLKLSEAEMRRIRGNEISMIFQEPMTSLNPVFTVGEQVAESLRFHRGYKKKEALARAIELLAEVGIPAPELRVKSYPHELSGGLRQRVMIAMAVACGPKLVIADEPTTALDVTVQAQILQLMEDLKNELGTAIILITHDLGVVAEHAQTVAVMYAGRVVEYAEVTRLFSRPLHPYTQGLLDSIPRLSERRTRLKPIPGVVPSVLQLGRGCTFRDRCAHRWKECADDEPELFEREDGHGVRCWRCAAGGEGTGNAEGGELRAVSRGGGL
ncbi:MAG: ABC transporter ATP-binding protein [Deltaproteobacteria bacterium]|nr:ABC transporter ATP-binding protein [Deltaproteobacteria bacterium]